MDEPKSPTAYDKLAQSYGIVFGLTPESRTAAQKAVWEHLQGMCFYNISTAVQNRNLDVQPQKMEICEGMRVTYLKINTLVELAKTISSDKQKKPKVKRT